MQPAEQCDEVAARWAEHTRAFAEPFAAVQAPGGALEGVELATLGARLERVERERTRGDVVDRERELRSVVGFREVVGDVGGEGVDSDAVIVHLQEYERVVLQHGGERIE